MLKKAFLFGILLIASIVVLEPRDSIVRADNACAISGFSLDQTKVYEGENVSVTYFVSGCTKSVITVTDTVTGKVLNTPYDGTGSGGGSFGTNISHKTTWKLDAYQGTTVAVSKELSADIISVSVGNEACTITSFTADKDSITRGSSTALRWQTSSGCGIIEIGLEDGNIRGEQSGTLVVSPIKTTVYSIFASKTQNDPVQFASVTVTVTDAPTAGTPVCTIISFSISPSSVEYPYTQSPMATWTTSGCSVVYISTIGVVLASGQYALKPTQTTTYTLTARDANDVEITKTATVVVTTSSQGNTGTIAPQTVSPGSGTSSFSGSGASVSSGSGAFSVNGSAFGSTGSAFSSSGSGLGSNGDSFSINPKLKTKTTSPFDTSVSSKASGSVNVSSGAAMPEDAATSALSADVNAQHVTSGSDYYPKTTQQTTTATKAPQKQTFWQRVSAFFRGIFHPGK